MHITQHCLVLKSHGLLQKHLAEAAAAARTAGAQRPCRKRSGGSHTKQCGQCLMKMSKESYIRLFG